MADKILICISAQQATAARWHGRRLMECQVFSGDDAGIAAFEEFLAPFTGVPAHFMVDAVEEDYRFETLPHAFGSDRTDMVRRKLRQHYRNTPYMNAWLLGRDSGRRRDDRFLFSALTNPDLVGGWLQAAAARSLPIAGIFLLPMVSTALIEELRLKAPNLLLVSQHSGGLRLTFCRERQFRLSRLTRGEIGKTGNRAQFIADEISNTRVYLHALRAARLDEQLTVGLLDRNDELIEAARSIASDNPSLECVRLGRAEIASRLNIAEPLLRLTADVMFLQLLGLRTPAGNLAPANVTVGFRRHQVRRGVHAAAAVAALVAAGWSGLNLWQVVDTRSQVAEAARHTAQLQRLYEEATRQFPAAPTSAENLRKAVELAQRLRDIARAPDRFMNVVSRALERSPDIVIAELGWKHGASEVDAAGSRTRASGVIAPPATGAARTQSGLVGGEVRPFRGDYRAATEAINAFAKRLAGDPAVAEVRVVKLPLNIDPALALSGNTLDSRDPSGSADFRLLVVLKPNV
ncbi:MAG: hypothetical protein HY526_13410 [Betaproteobacteria bacterium]|nr:hypothetical protein [Betaproteobacteria bacterium]